MRNTSMIAAVPLIVSSMLVSHSLSGQAVGTWRSGGPFGGYVSSLAIDPKTPSTLYAGTASGGVFKSTDSGATWVAATSGLMSMQVNALAIDPVTPSTLYAGTVEGVFKSTDSGGKWMASKAGLTDVYVLALAVNPATPSTLYAGTQRAGVFRSTDSGATWAAPDAGPASADVRALAIDARIPSTVYAAGSGAFRSTDSGVTWTTLNGGGALALAVNPSASATIYKGGLLIGVSKSTDSGETWATASAGLTNKNVNALALDPVTPSTLYAGTGDFRFDSSGGVFKSTDGGATWAAAGSGLAGSFVYALGIDPVRPASLYAGTSRSGVFRSTDSGAAWTSGSTGFTALGTYALAADPSRPGTLYAGTAAGVFKSTDTGTTWAAMNAGLTSAAVRALVVDSSAPTNLYAGVAGSVFRSTDSGATWAAASAGLSASQVNVLTIVPTIPATLYAGTSAGVYRRITSDTTWELMGNPRNLGVLTLAVHPAAPSTMYAGTPGGVFKSTDSGAAWSARLGQADQVESLAIDPTTSTIYAGTVNGGVMRSSDAGATWGAANAGLPSRWVSALAISPINSPTLFAGTRQDGVFLSTNSGTSWAPDNGGLPWVAPAVPKISALLIGPGDTKLYAGLSAGSVWQMTLSDAPLLLSHGRVRVTVDWRNQYSGQTGTAHAIPQKDEFGFFYFTDPNNPEVFVKVLDFGAGGALCFVGGLSDFYYKVTFTSTATGQTLVFEKVAGAYVGFADNGSLKFARAGIAGTGTTGAPGVSANVNAGVETPVLVGTLPLGGDAPRARSSVRTPDARILDAPQSLTLSQGRVLVTVDWRNQYSGASGTAFAIPQQDGFGFFYFSDPNNPEVFVKVLDFGAGGALCFVGGLSDFYYKVTFKTLRTGQTLVFEKAAGLYLGFADNGALRF